MMQAKTLHGFASPCRRELHRPLHRLRAASSAWIRLDSRWRDLYRRFIFQVLFGATCAGAFGCSYAQVSAAPKVCQTVDFWSTCATKVKNAIKSTNSLEVASNAAGEWAERYSALYKANARNTWTPSDADRMDQVMDGLWDELVGKYLDPATLAFSLALQRYFPTLAATLELAGSPYVAPFMVLLAPSPIANDFTQAKPVNEEINALLMQKLPVPTALTIKNRYPELFRQSFDKVKGPNKLP